MTIEILLALALLAGAVIAFATGRFRLDLVALTVLVLVAILGLAPVEQVLAGFANPAVLAIAGMFVISAALSRTGVADMVGRWILRVAGTGELRLVLAVTLVSATLSGFVNNIGVVAMMLPVVVEIARKVETAPSKLLIPMAMGAQLGGFTTLIGTSPNLLAGDALREAGFEPFHLFAFTPVGAALVLAGTLLVVLVAPRVLPERTPVDRRGVVVRPGIREGVGLEERLLVLEVPVGSPLLGRSLEESLMGPALGLRVLAIEREGDRILAPGPGTHLHAGDRMVVQGSPDYFMELKSGRHLIPESGEPPAVRLETAEVGLASFRIAPDSTLRGKTVGQAHFRDEEGLLVLALRRPGFRRRTHLLGTPLESGDLLLVQGARERLDALAKAEDFEEVTPLTGAEAVETFELNERLWSLKVLEGSVLAGKRLAEARLGDDVGMVVLAVEREGERVALPPADLELEPGDLLLVKSRPEDLLMIRGLQRLILHPDEGPGPEELEGPDVGFVEVVLAPRSALIGKTIREVQFRGRFGLHVVAIVREGEVLRTNLRDETLRFGDALLLYGSRSRARALAREPDFILLREPSADPPDYRLAPRSVLILGAALTTIIAGWLPVAVGVLTGAVLMVVTRCITPEEAYRAIDWPTLVLVAGMLALGAALAESGTATMLGEQLLGLTAGGGPMGLLVALTLVTAVGAQIIPAPAIVVLMAPIALTGAAQLEVSPYPLVLAVAIAATSLASPVSQPAQALVMAPAGYRMGDFLRLGIPMTLVVLALTILLAPVVFPF
ncbi:MAG: SLC13 family permease [Gemmatimonadota bacterium]